MRPLYDPPVIAVGMAPAWKRGMSNPTTCDCNAPETRTDSCDGCGERREGVSQYQDCAVVLHLCHACGRTEPAPCGECHGSECAEGWPPRPCAACVPASTREAIAAGL
jgi:hypothetical protein